MNTLRISEDKAWKMAENGKYKLPKELFAEDVKVIVRVDGARTIDCAGSVKWNLWKVDQTPKLVQGMSEKDRRMPEPPGTWSDVDWSTDIATIKLKNGRTVECVRTVRASGTALYCIPTN